MKAASSTSSWAERPWLGPSRSSLLSHRNRSCSHTTFSRSPSTPSGACSCTLVRSTLVRPHLPPTVSILDGVEAYEAFCPFPAVSDVEKPTSQNRKIERWAKPSPLDYPALTLRAFLVVRLSFAFSRVNQRARRADQSCLRASSFGRLVRYSFLSSGTRSSKTATCYISLRDSLWSTTGRFLLMSSCSCLHSLAALRFAKSLSCKKHHIM